MKWATLVTGQIGLAMGRWLPYAGGGFAIGKGEATFTSPVTPPGGISRTRTHTGYTVLTGLRYALADNWWVALQYNYTDVGSETYTFAPLTGTCTVDFKSHSLAGLVSYRWGAGRVN